MDVVYVALTVSASALWLAAAGAYGATWGLAKPGLRRWGDAWVVAGMLLTLVAGEWLSVSNGPGWAFSRAGLALGLALVMLALRLALGWLHVERVSLLPLLALALGLQAYAWLAVGWDNLPAVPTYWPAWHIGRALVLLLGCAALANALAALAMHLVAERVAAHTANASTALASELSVLHDSALRLAVLGTSLALTLAGFHAWWAYGQPIAGNLAWLIIAWLLLVAGAGGRWLMGSGQRTAFLVLAGALLAALAATLTMTL